MEGNYPFYILRDSAIFEFFRVADYHTYRKLWERMNAEDTFVNSTDEGYATTRKIQNAVFMSEEPSTEYTIMQKPCDLRTGMISFLNNRPLFLVVNQNEGGIFEIYLIDTRKKTCWP